MDIPQIVIGLVGLVVGGELLVRGAVAIANRWGVSPLMIGLTLVGFGTSTPELVTSIEAALAGAPGIAIGNVVGSNIANILLILGLTAVMTPLAVQPQSFWRDGSMLLAATLAGIAFMAGGWIGRGSGAAALVILFAYIAATYWLERRRQTAAAVVYKAEAEQIETPASIGLLLSAAMLVGGLALTIFAARLLVAGAVGLATDFGISETVIGLTVVAVGTSMPEMVTSLVAARKGQVDVALGNVIGSNIFNILGILGATAVIHPLEIPSAILEVDAWVMLAATLVLGAVALTGWRINRREGLAMAAAYVGYTVYLISRS
jgi:cation:H+ antiporter